LEKQKCDCKDKQGDLAQMMRIKHPNCNPGMLGIETYVINPKAMTYNQLYGNFDSISQEFSNGVIGTTFQN